MKLGFLTACLPGQRLETILDWAGQAGYQALEVAAWPALGDRPFTATHIAAETLHPAEADAVRARFDAAGQVRFDRLTHSRACAILANPVYAGAYVFGRFRSRRRPSP